MNYCLIPVTPYAQNCSLIWCTHTQEAALVDPGGDAQLIQATIAKHPVTVKQILLTHGHWDHVGAAAYLAEYYQVPIIGPHLEDKFLLDDLPRQTDRPGFQKCAPFTPDRFLEEGEKIRIGQITLEVFHCPGHTPGHVVFFHREGKCLISGDVIFKGSVGRTDFPRSSHQALICSIKEKLLPLGDDVTFIPGHGERSTLGEERLNNPFLIGIETKRNNF